MSLYLELALKHDTSRLGLPLSLYVWIKPMGPPRLTKAVGGYRPPSLSLSLSVVDGGALLH